MKTILALPLAVMTILAIAPLAHASSSDAWAALAADVKAKCAAAAKPSLKSAKVAVDPFGSERFGLAIVTGPLKARKGKASFICVYDKRTKAVEIGSELGSDIVTVGVPK